MEKIVFIAISIAIIACDLVLAVISWRSGQRDAKRVSSIALTVALSLASYLVAINIDGFFAFSFCMAIYYCCVSSVLLQFLLYVNAYLGDRNRRLELIFIVLVVIDVTVEMFNPFTGHSVVFQPSDNPAFGWDVVSQLPFKLHLLLCYVIIAVVVFLLVRKIVRTPRAYHAKYLIIVIGLAFAVVINAVVLVYQNKGMLDYSQFSYSLLAAFLVFELLVGRKWALMNSMRQVIVDELGHPVILFDERGAEVLRNDRMDAFFRESHVDGTKTPLQLGGFIGLMGFDRALEGAVDDAHFLYRVKGAKSFQSTFRVDFHPLKNGKEKVFGRLFVFTDETLETDRLTGFFSMNAFERRFADRGANRYPVTVGVCDINSLSLINREQGEEAGDEAIRLLARALEQECPEGSYFVRLESANLLVVCEETGSAEMRSYLAKVRERIATAKFGARQLGIQSAIATATKDDPDVQAAVENAVTSMKERKLMDGGSIHSSLLGSLAQVLEETDKTTTEHVRRTRIMGEKLGRRLNFTDLQMSNLSLLCLLHDIGKVAIPRHILLNPGRLEGVDWETMKTHAEKGYNIAMASRELSGIADCILHHHENWDGSGYPDGLSRESIPLLSRVIQVVDAYDAMVNERPYKPAMTSEQARRELERGAGKQFDPHIVAEFLQVLDEMLPAEDIPLSFVPNAGGLLTPRPYSKDREVGQTSMIRPISFSRYFLDADQYVIAIDDEFTNLTGYTQEDIETFHLNQNDLVPIEDRTQYWEVVRDMLSENGKAEIEHRIMRKDGSIIFANCFGLLKTDPETDKTVSEIIAMDVTQSTTFSKGRQEERERADRAAAAWEEMARRDSLTGLLNHEAFVREVETALMDKTVKVCLVLLDVDNFKMYNDSMGHAEGDKLLQLVARTLREQVESSGFAGRLGGDEFAAVITFAVDAYSPERVRENVDSLFDVLSSRLKSGEHPSGVSIGATVSGEQRDTFSSLYLEADMALYSSKRMGRDRSTVCY